MEENEALEKVKKSCKIGKNVVSVFVGLCIFFIVTLIIVSISLPIMFGGVKGAIRELGLDYTDIVSYGSEGLEVEESGVLEHYDVFNTFLEHDYYVLAYTYLFGVEFVAFTLTLLILCNLRAILKTIQNSESPFGESTVKKMKKCFIFIGIFSLFYGGIFSLLIDLGLWCIYKVFRYGSLLQKQVDETL